MTEDDDAVLTVRALDGGGDPVYTDNDPGFEVAINGAAYAAHAIGSLLHLTKPVTRGPVKLYAVAVIGGAEIFAMLGHLATRWEITEVFEDTAGDVFMPLPDPADWIETAREHRHAAHGWPAHDFVTYRRRAR